MAGRCEEAFSFYTRRTAKSNLHPPCGLALPPSFALPPHAPMPWWLFPPEDDVPRQHPTFPSVRTALTPRSAGDAAWPFSLSDPSPPFLQWPGLVLLVEVGGGSGAQQSPPPSPSRWAVIRIHVQPGPKRICSGPFIALGLCVALPPAVGRGRAFSPPPSATRKEKNASIKGVFVQLVQGSRDGRRGEGPATTDSLRPLRKGGSGPAWESGGAGRLSPLVGNEKVSVAFQCALNPASPGCCLGTPALQGPRGEVGRAWGGGFYVTSGGAANGGYGNSWGSVCGKGNWGRGLSYNSWPGAQPGAQHFSGCLPKAFRKWVGILPSRAPGWLSDFFFKSCFSCNYACNRKILAEQLKLSCGDPSGGWLCLRWRPF